MSDRCAMCHGAGFLNHHDGDVETQVACPRCRGAGTNEWVARAVQAKRRNGEWAQALSWLYLIFGTFWGLSLIASLSVGSMLEGLVMVIISVVIVVRKLNRRQQRTGGSGDGYKAVTYGAMGYSVYKAIKKDR